MNDVKKLIEGLTILSKYVDDEFSLTNQDRELCVDVDPAKVSSEDFDKLISIKFKADFQNKMFYCVI